MQKQTAEVTEKRTIPPWVPIAISSLALVISCVEWWNNRELARSQAAPRVSFMEENGTSAPVIGIQMVNDGPSIRVKEVTYYVDKKPGRTVDDALGLGNLSDEVKDSIDTFEYGDDSTLAVGEKQWIFSMERKGKSKRT